MNRTRHGAPVADEPKLFVALTRDEFLLLTAAASTGFAARGVIINADPTRHGALVTQVARTVDAWDRVAEEAAHPAVLAEMFLRMGRDAAMTWPGRIRLDIVRLERPTERPR